MFSRLEYAEGHLNQFSLHRSDDAFDDEFGGGLAGGRQPLEE